MTNEGRTHWEGCWREPSHHACAVALIERWHAAFPVPDDEDEDSYYPEYGELAVTMADRCILNHRLSELLREIAKSGVEFECRKYVTVQVNAETWAALKQWQEETRK